MSPVYCQWSNSAISKPLLKWCRWSNDELRNLATSRMASDGLSFGNQCPASSNRRHFAASDGHRRNFRVRLTRLRNCEQGSV